MRKKWVLLTCVLLATLCACSQKGGDSPPKDGSDQEVSQSDSSYSQSIDDSSSNTDESQPDDSSSSADDSVHACDFATLTLVHAPDTTTYEEGDAFSTEGMVVALVCTCGEKQTVTDYEVVYPSGGKAFSIQDTMIIIRSENQEIKIPITVGTWTQPMPL